MRRPELGGRVTRRPFGIGGGASDGRLGGGLEGGGAGTVAELRRGGSGGGFGRSRPLDEGLGASRTPAPELGTWVSSDEARVLIDPPPVASSSRIGLTAGTGPCALHARSRAHNRSSPPAPAGFSRDGQMTKKTDIGAARDCAAPMMQVVSAQSLGAYTGMTPRFFAGLSRRLWRESSRPQAIARRVSRGSITSSTKPHPATL